MHLGPPPLTVQSVAVTVQPFCEVLTQEKLEPLLKLPSLPMLTIWSGSAPQLPDCWTNCTRYVAPFVAQGPACGWLPLDGADDDEQATRAAPIASGARDSLWAMGKRNGRIGLGGHPLGMRWPRPA
jgi:hypothetical protein